MNFNGFNFMTFARPRTHPMPKISRIVTFGKIRIKRKKHQCSYQSLKPLMKMVRLSWMPWTASTQIKFKLTKTGPSLMRKHSNNIISI
jgi:hypothetical protein